MSIQRLTIVSVLAVTCLAGCSKSESTADQPAAEPSADFALPPARTLPLPGQVTAVPPPAGEQATAGVLAWELPQGWQAEQPASRMRLAQYRVEGAAGPGECIVYYFGPGQGGDPMSNAARWAGQFAQPGGGDSAAAMRVSEFDGAPMGVHLVEVTGTYDGGMTMTDAPAEKKVGYMLLGAIVEGPDAPWFFKFTGPEATVRSQREAFVGMMRTLRVAQG